MSPPTPRIAVDALGKDAVKGVTMPGPFSSEGSWKDSEVLAKRLGIDRKTLYRKMRQYNLWNASATGTGK